MLNLLTLSDLRALKPCYDPVKYLPEGWKGTILDILNIEECPTDDRVWVATHKGICSDKVLRLFAVWCARETFKLVTKPDPRSINACNVAERFANNQATKEELSATRSAASSAAWSAAGSAAGAAAASAASAAWSAAGSSAASAAGSAAATAAGSAAGSAAWSAWSAAGPAAGSAAGSAAWSAWSAAGSAAGSAQIEKLKELLLQYGDE